MFCFVLSLFGRYNYLCFPSPSKTGKQLYYWSTHLFLRAILLVAKSSVPINTSDNFSMISVLYFGQCKLFANLFLWVFFQFDSCPLRNCAFFLQMNTFPFPFFFNAFHTVSLFFKADLCDIEHQISRGGICQFNQFLVVTRKYHGYWGVHLGSECKDLYDELMIEGITFEICQGTVNQPVKVELGVFNERIVWAMWRIQ